MTDQFLWYSIQFGIDLRRSRMRSIMSTKILQRKKNHVDTSRHIRLNVHRLVHWLQSMKDQFVSWLLIELIRFECQRPCEYHRMIHRHLRAEPLPMLIDQISQERALSFDHRFVRINEYSYHFEHLITRPLKMSTITKMKNKCHSIRNNVLYIGEKGAWQSSNSSINFCASSKYDARLKQSIWKSKSSIQTIWRRFVVRFTIAVVILCVLIGRLTKIDRASLTSPACEHAFITDTCAASLNNSTGIWRYNSTASLPIPFNP